MNMDGSFMIAVNGMNLKDAVSENFSVRQPLKEKLKEHAEIRKCRKAQRGRVRFQDETAASKICIKTESD